MGYPLFGLAQWEDCHIGLSLQEEESNAISESEDDKSGEIILNLEGQMKAKFSRGLSIAKNDQVEVIAIY